MRKLTGASSADRRPWLAPGVGGIGSASFLADVGYQVPTALMASFVTATLGTSAAALGLVEGISDGLAGAGRFVGGALAGDPQRRRAVAVRGYPATAMLLALMGATTSVTATLLILRATDVLTPGRGVEGATQIGIALYVVYNIAATIISLPADGFTDKLGPRGPLLVTAAGVAAFLLAYGLFAISGPMIVLLGVAFAVAGVGIGCAETAAVAAFATDELRGSAFGLLATGQAVGNVAASVVAGLLYTVASPAIAFVYLTVWMLIALATLGWVAAPSGGRGN
jgi:Major Facilitator Superfamily